MTLDDRIKEVFAEAFDVSPDEIPIDLSMETSSDWDSMRTITLSFSLEQAFAVEFTDVELMKIESFIAVRELLVGKGVS